MRISKLSLICRFDKELTEIFKVKDITQSCSKNLMSGVGLSDPLPSVIELSYQLSVNGHIGLVLFGLRFYRFFDTRDYQLSGNPSNDNEHGK